MLDYKIIQLDKDISNKIAAGEVVERPLAVVKELVENAIDAQASKITVEIKDAGKSLIRVTDDGFGIQPDDVLLAFERHSTSKIRTINDIYHISSLGFRGEALASISSVSNMEVISKHKDHDMGKKLNLSGGKVLEHIEVGAPSGTTMMVKDLFFNTPARLKFLKSNNAEQNAINDIMTKLALSHPEIAFKYIVNGQNIFITPGNNRLYDVILNIYQRSLAKNLIEVNYEDNGIKLSGFISSIELTRGNRQYQIAFVNNRYVKSKTIEDAIATVYRTLIPHNRFPIVFLNVAIDPSLIDINIHPAKTEIRFHQEGVIKDLIYKALKYEINRYNLVPDKEISSKSIPNREVLKTFIEANKKDDEVKVNPKHYNPHIEKPSKKEKEVLLNSYKALNQKDEVIIEETQFENKVDELIYEAPKNEVTKSLVREIEKPLSRPLIRETETVISKPLVREEQVLEQVYEPPKQLFEKENETIYDHLNFVGQIFNSYLIYEKNAEMYIIDQHAAHEKILYEKFLDDYKKKNSEEFKCELDNMMKKLENNLLATEDILFRDKIVSSKEEINEMFLEYYKSMPLYRRSRKIRRILFNKITSIRNEIFYEIEADYKKELDKFSDSERNIQENNIALNRRMKIEELIRSVMKAKDELTYLKGESVLKYYNQINNNKELNHQDLAPILYLELKLNGIRYEREIKHIVIDEAQDWSNLQLEVIKEYTKCNNFTIVGDCNQSMLPMDKENVLNNFDNILDNNIYNFKL